MLILALSTEVFPHLSAAFPPTVTRQNGNRMHLDSARLGPPSRRWRGRRGPGTSMHPPSSPAILEGERSWLLRFLR